MKTLKLVLSIFMIVFVIQACFLPRPSRPWEKGKQRVDAPSREREAPYTTVIVIDPGHGGKDPGAIGKKRTREKDIVLQISKLLAAELKRRLNARVILTRTGDRFLTLDQRNVIAQKWQADVFISLHANSAESHQAKGVDIYTLNNATDEASRRLARRENKGVKMNQEEVETILATMIQNDGSERALDLAKWVGRSLQRQLKNHYQRSNEIRIKSALFYVLVGAQTASILVETGFLTHPEEEKLLRSKSHQYKIAEALAIGIEDYLKKSKVIRQTL